MQTILIKKFPILTTFKYRKKEIIMSKKILYLSLCAAIFLPTQAHAISKKISSPHVHKGHVIVENYGYFEFDDEDKWKNTTELEYGVTDHLMLAIAGEIEKEEGESLEYEATEIEAVYLLTGEESYVHSAVKLAYEMNHLGGADKIETKLGYLVGISEAASDNVIKYEFEIEF